MAELVKCSVELPIPVTIAACVRFTMEVDKSQGLTDKALRKLLAARVAVWMAGGDEYSLAVSVVLEKLKRTEDLAEHLEENIQYQTYDDSDVAFARAMIADKDETTLRFEPVGEPNETGRHDR